MSEFKLKRYEERPATIAEHRALRDDIAQLLSERAKLRTLLHGVLNGDPKVEQEAREMLYGREYDPEVAPCGDAEFGMKP